MILLICDYWIRNAASCDVLSLSLPGSHVVQAPSDAVRKKAEWGKLEASDSKFSVKAPKMFAQKMGKHLQVV